MSTLTRHIGTLFKLRTAKQKDRAILQWLHEHPGWQNEFDISQGAGLPDGTIYPTLARLFRKGWIERQWIEQPEGSPAPHRRMYRVKMR